MASARPCETRNCAASAAQAISIAEPSTEGKVHSAEATPALAVVVGAAQAITVFMGLLSALRNVSFSKRDDSLCWIVKL